MNYPISFRFKIAAIASQISARDTHDNELLYVKQKLFKFKEKIEVYQNSTKSQLLFTLQADRVIDFSPVLLLSDAQGNEIGTVKRQGRASIWKATYNLSLKGASFAEVREAKPWVKFFDAILREVPILSLFGGYVLHPRYIITASNGTILGELEKTAGFFEQNYVLKGEGMAELEEDTQRHLMVMILAVTLRERLRG